MSYSSEIISLASSLKLKYTLEPSFNDTIKISPNPPEELNATLIKGCKYPTDETFLSSRLSKALEIETLFSSSINYVLLYTRKMFRVVTHSIGGEPVKSIGLFLFDDENVIQEIKAKLMKFYFVRPDPIPEDKVSYYTALDAFIAEKGITVADFE